jgi:hypothetical protein
VGVYTPRGRREGGKASVLEVKDPRVLIMKDWDIVIQLSVGEVD